MKQIFTWNSLRIFFICYLTVLAFNILITILDSSFDVAAQLSTKSLLFNMIGAAFLTLIKLSRAEEPEHQDTKA